MKRSLIYTAVFSAMMMVTGCGGEDGGVTITNQPSNQVDKDNKGEDKTKNIDNEEAKIIPIVDLETVTAPYPISKAKKISIGQSVEISSKADIYYAVELEELGLYSFDIGSLSEKTTSEDLGWGIYDGTGAKIGLMTGDYFRWTPPSTGIYYIRPGQGTVLKVKKHGTASADPYTLGAGFGNGVAWLFDKIIATYGDVGGTKSMYFTNLYAKEAYRITYDPPGVAGKVALETVGGEEIYSSRVEADQIRTLTVSGLDSDTYIVRYTADKRPLSGAAIMTKVERLPDADKDGDPDETDPYPHNPKRHRGTENNSSGENNNGSVSGLKPDYLAQKAPNACKGYTIDNYKQRLQELQNTSFEDRGEEYQLSSHCANAYNYYAHYRELLKVGKKAEAEKVYDYFVSSADVTIATWQSMSTPKYTFK